MLEERNKEVFRMSADEIEARIRKHQEGHVEPVKQAVALLEAGLEKVLAELGVDIESGDFPTQQEALGIFITEETRPEYAKLNGFYVFAIMKGELKPYAWIGAARIDENGECFVDIQRYQTNAGIGTLEETGGIKIIPV